MLAVLLVWTAARNLPHSALKSEQVVLVFCRALVQTCKRCLTALESHYQGFLYIWL